MTPDFGTLGFGFLRLPHIDPDDSRDVDLDIAAQMVDLFLERGFRYFDTAYTYLDGMSEISLRKTLVERHPRDSFMIADKLPCGMLRRGKTKEEIFAEQLRRCGVDYFDVYLLHGLDGEDAVYAEEQGCFDFLRELKQQGKARYIGFSFHDTADVLDGILTRHPEVDVVQIQLNYLDWDNPIIQSGSCWEVCRRHGKPVIVMEPVKGGSLVNLPQEAADLLTDYSQAGYALRFAASPENVFMVLSGMSDMAQMQDNIATMGDFKAFSPAEYETIDKVRTIYQAQNKIPCTACRYCTDGCPAGIDIPGVFACLNDKRQGAEGADARYAAYENKADSCVGCGQCEEVCPQHLHIRQLLKDVAGLAK